MRHQAGIVDDHIHAAVRLHGVLDETFHLAGIGHVRLHRGLVAELELPGERLQLVETGAPSTSFAPSPASRRAAASPNPLLAPVMTMTLS